MYTDEDFYLSILENFSIKLNEKILYYENNDFTVTEGLNDINELCLEYDSPFTWDFLDQVDLHVYGNIPDLQKLNPDKKHFIDVLKGQKINFDNFMEQYGIDDYKLFPEEFGLE